jgi:hypothetical protein
MLLADCFAGLIWRVDLSDQAHKATADVWVSHDTMWHDADSEVPPPLQPGVNGVRYGAKTGYVYYTSTAQKVVGPSSAYWGREPGDVGNVMYVTTDGGTTAPPDGIVRNAALVRVELKAPTAS